MHVLEMLQPIEGMYIKYAGFLSVLQRSMKRTIGDSNELSLLEELIFLGAKSMKEFFTSKRNRWFLVCHIYF